MDAAGIVAFCREKGVGLLVDAAHPFAVQLRENIKQAAVELGIPVIRYERTYPARDTASSGVNPGRDSSIISVNRIYAICWL